MAWLLLLVFATFYGPTVHDVTESNVKYVYEFCNPFVNNERVPRIGIFHPPNINCPTYAIVCHSSGLGFYEHCPPGQVFLSGSCQNAPPQCSTGRYSKISGSIDLITLNPHYQFPTRSELVFPAFVNDYPSAVVPFPTTCGEFEIFSHCPASCEFTCPRRHTHDCYHPPNPCKPSCRCREGYSRRLSDNRCIKNNACHSNHKREWSRHHGRDFGEERSETGESDDDINDEVDKFFCDERNHGYHAMPGGERCSELYYKCHHSKVEFMRCARGKHFDESKGRCVSRSKTCWDKVKSLDPFFCQGKYELTNYSFPFPQCSKQYYTCSDGQSQVHRCDGGLVFSERKRECVRPKKCDRIPRHDNDPDHWFCADKIDNHGFSFPKSKCSTRYYQCENNLAAFRRCPPDHFFDGFNCVPGQYCLDTDDEEEDSLDADISKSGEVLKNFKICSTLLPYSFVITHTPCNSEFAICVDDKTTTHKCGRSQVFSFDDTSYPNMTLIFCTSSKSCHSKRTSDNQLQNKDFPLSDDFCADKEVGFYPEKECGQKYGFCYCANNNDTLACTPKLIRLTCPNRRYVFNKEMKQCTLRRQVKACRKECGHF